MLTRPLAASACLCALVSGLRAEDAAPAPGPATDVRFVYSLAGDRYEIRPDNGTRTSGTWDRSESLRLELLRSQLAPFGLGGGLSLSGTRKSEEHAGERLSLDALSGRVDLAMTTAPIHRVQVEVVPFAGYGLSEFAYCPTPASGGTRTRDRDGFIEYGLNVNAVLTTPSGIQVGGAIGYAIQDGTYDLDIGSTRVESSGPVYSVFIGTRH